MSILFFTNYRTNLRQDRRGVILLLVMSVLALFSVIGITFVLMTGRSRETAETMAKFSPGAATGGMTAQQLLEEGVMQVLVGPGETSDGDPSRYSALYKNDLLGDMYGYTGSDTATATFTQTGSGYCECSLRDEKYAGRVVTITSGKYKGYSTVILNKEGLCLPFPKGAPSGDSVSVVVNNRPFQGDDNYDAFSQEGSENKFMALRYPGGASNSKYRAGEIVVPSYYRSTEDNKVRPGCVADTDNSPGSEIQDSSKQPNLCDVDNDGDGALDSMWINAGLPPQAMADGTLVIPMFAILTEDMDGRLNVNAHGNEFQLQAGACSIMTGAVGQRPIQLIAGSASKQADDTDINGVGYGPAEVNLQPLFASSGQYDNLIKERSSTTNLQYMQYRFPDMNYSLYPSTTSPENYTFKVSLPGNEVPHYGSPLDLFGKMIPGVDQNGMHVWLLSSNQTAGKNPYEKIDLGQSSPRNEELQGVFTPDELEAVLRVYDDDAGLLCDRLTQYLGLDDAARFNIVKNLVTTESWDIPSCDPTKLSSQNNVPAEVKAGFMMDINRPLTDYESNSTQADAERTKLAEDLYYLLKAADSSVDSARAAQWAVNAVDFRDADHVSTRIQIDGKYYFGCERPELLITETFAFHARMTENDGQMGWVQKPTNSTGSSFQMNDHINDALEIYAKNKCKSVEDFINNYPTYAQQMGYNPNSNDNSSAVEKIQSVINKIDKNQTGVVSLDQISRPESGFYVEIYNPWLSAGSTEPVSSKDLFKNSANGSEMGVDLAKLSNSGNNPVWRLAVIHPHKLKNTDGFAGEPEAAENPERVVYFTNKTTSFQDSSAYRYAATAPQDSVLKPGKLAVVGPQQQVTLRNDGSKVTASLTDSSLNLGSVSSSGILGFRVLNDLKNPGKNIRLSLTEDKSFTYPMLEGGVLSSSLDAPLESTNTKIWDGDTSFSPAGNGLSDDFEEKGFRVVFLQRLANPYLPYNANTNPYIYVDSMPVNLYCYNGRQIEFPDYKSNSVYGKIKAGTWNKGMSGSIKSVHRTSNIWQAEKVQSGTAAGLAQSSWGSGVIAKSDVASAQLSYNDVPSFFFPNRPFNSVMELALVPQVSCYELTSSATPIVQPNGTNLPEYMSKYINFTNGKASKLFNYVRVQSPYNCSPMVLNVYPNSAGDAKTSAISKYRWLYREPGKININSMNHPAIWAALLNRPSISSGVSLTNIIGTETYMKMPGRSDNIYESLFKKSFESENSGVKATTLFRNNTAATTDSNYLLGHFSDFRLSDTGMPAYAKPSLSPYFQFPLLQRLSNLTTTRSNVYSVWITVGFFEYKGRATGGDGVSPYRIGKEYGVDNGSQVRHRAFYLIDRTIPVGYEPGKRHNADQTILVRRYLP